MPHHKHRRLPAWVILAMGSAITGAAVLWTSTLYDDRGHEVLDGPAATVIVAIVGVVGTVLGLLLQRSGEVRHELHPNSGSTLRDATDRAEKAAKEALEIARRTEAKTIQTAADLRDLREDTQALRIEGQGTASDLRGIRRDIGRIVDHITKETS